eukprot:2459136-Rhodomonas_salina.2
MWRGASGTWRPPGAYARHGEIKCISALSQYSLYRGHGCVCLFSAARGTDKAHGVAAYGTIEAETYCTKPLVQY